MDLLQGLFYTMLVYAILFYTTNSGLCKNIVRTKTLSIIVHPEMLFCSLQFSSFPESADNYELGNMQTDVFVCLCFTVFQLLTHIFKTVPLFKALHTNPRIAHTKCKMPHISCKMKHCIQNITNTSQKQTFANIFAIILIPVRFLCIT